MTSHKRFLVESPPHFSNRSAAADYGVICTLWLWEFNVKMGKVKTLTIYTHTGEGEVNIGE
jgi:hypothetical protein